MKNAQLNAAASVCYSDFHFYTFLISKIIEIMIFTFGHSMAPTTIKFLTIVLGMVRPTDQVSALYDVFIVKRNFQGSVWESYL